MSNRAAVKRRIANDIAPFALTAVDLGVDGRNAERVTVTYGPPPAEMADSGMYFADLAPTAGRLDVAGMRRNSPRMDDSFTLKGTIDAFGFDDDQAAEEAAERILNAFRLVLDRCQGLLDRTNGQPTPDGVPDGDDPTAFQVSKAYVGDWSMTPYAPIGDTCVARAEFAIECVSVHA